MPMNRLLPLALLTLFLVAAPSAYGARGFSSGVAAGEVTASSAVLWGKANKAGSYGVQVAANRRFRKAKGFSTRTSTPCRASASRTGTTAACCAG
jgi:phosphodiesterase/alkaline phosphatase D-like protein